MPTACAAIEIRPPSSVERAMRNPSSLAEEVRGRHARRPGRSAARCRSPGFPELFLELSNREPPASPFSTMNAAITLLLLQGFVCAKTMATVAEQSVRE